MKSVIRWSAIVILSALVPLAAQSAELTLSDAERAELVTLLEESRRQFEELTALTNGDAWNQKPAEDKWSVGETVEHLVIAEEKVFARVQAALAGEKDPDWKTIAGMSVGQVVANVGDRTQKFQAPEPFQPKGEMSRGELLKKYAYLRAHTLDYVRTTDAPLKGYTSAGPAGKMNAHQWIGVIGAHNLRHNAQIAETQAVISAP